MIALSSMWQLHDIIGKVLVFLGRPAVQLQLTLIAGAIGVAWFASRRFWGLLGMTSTRSVEPDSGWDTTSGPLFVLALLYRLTFPILALLLLEVTQRLLDTQEITSGLFGKVAWIIWSAVALQMLITLLYALFDSAKIRVYHYRLFLPMVVIIVLLNILGNLTDLSALGSTVLTEVFNNPVTLGAFFMATVGLYFWTDAAHMFQDLAYQLAVRHTRADPGGVMAGLTLVRYILVGIGVLFVLSQLQLAPTTLAAITGGLSVGVGFGLREILSNLISGILLLFEQSLHPGDVIEVDNDVSVVEDVRMRATIVRTQNNDELVIPNQTFFTASFKTYTGTDKTVRVPIPFRTDCATPPREVIQVLIQAALSHPRVLRDPYPSAFVLDYGDNTARFQLNIWLDNPIPSAEVSSELRLLVWDAFADYGISLPSPELELRLAEGVSTDQVSPAQPDPLEVYIRQYGAHAHR